MSAPRLRVEHIGWTVAGRAVLDNVTFDVDQGECVAILGRNGAGKSTLLDIIAGLREPSSGAVMLDGVDARRWTPGERAKRVAHLPQLMRSDLPFQVHELVLMGRYPHTDRWFESADDHRAVEQAMVRTDCWDLRHRQVQTLSGGERQRVLLAACLAQAAQMLLLDEPSTHLDIDQQLHCFAQMKEESERGVTCVAVTHDLNLALAYASRLIVMADGRVAHDIAVSDAAAHTDWLSTFSPRLALATSPAGRPWVSYS